MRGKILLQGISGSPGTATGYVRIVRSNEEDAFDDDTVLVEKGDILVCDEYRPRNNYEKCLINAAALVQNRGGRGAYGAIGSIGFGIPSVVGTVKATEVLKNGMAVIVEGETGEKEVIKKNGEIRKVKIGAVYQYLPD
jgi:phosphoenolpyruvate synthase/pyruvate phosphate dikinase